MIFNTLEKIKLFAIGFLGSILIRILIGTMTIEERPDKYPRKLKQQGKGVLYAIWHSCMLVSSYTGRNLGTKVLISRHTDGEYIAQVVKWLGFSTVRGSTTRGGVNALLALIKKSQEGTSIAITPDGPRGPRFIVQPGIIFLGQKTNYPIIPVSLGLTNYWKLPSWDGFRIPKPFSRAILIYGDPIKIPPDIKKDEIEEYRVLLEETMNKAAIEADCLIKA